MRISIRLLNSLTVCSRLVDLATASSLSASSREISLSRASAAPRTLDALAELRARSPQARLLAGGTDIGLWVNKQFRDLGDIVYAGEVDELARIDIRDDQLYIGAGAKLEDAWSALAAHWPEGASAEIVDYQRGELRLGGLSEISAQQLAGVPWSTHNYQWQVQGRIAVLRSGKTP